MQRVARGHWGVTKKFISTATSGFGDSDIDVFFWGLSPAAATSKLQRLMQQLHANRAMVSCSSMDEVDVQGPPSLCLALHLPCCYYF
jgi:hypothetical protein